MAQIPLERLDRVEGARGKGRRAGGGGREGVDERQLDQIVALAAAGDKAAGLRDDDADLRAIVETASKVGVGLFDEADELGVERDCIDIGGAMVERHKSLGAAASAEDQHMRAL